MIKSALKNNDFLKNLENSLVHEIVNCMYEETNTKGQYIIKENEAGNHLYVSSGTETTSTGPPSLKSLFSGAGCKFCQPDC